MNKSTASALRFWSCAALILGLFLWLSFAPAEQANTTGTVALGLIFYAFVLWCIGCAIWLVVSFAFGLLGIARRMPEAHAVYRQAKHEQQVEQIAQGMERAAHRYRQR